MAAEHFRLPADHAPNARGERTLACPAGVAILLAANRPRAVKRLVHDGWRLAYTGRFAVLCWGTLTDVQVTTAMALAADTEAESAYLGEVAAAMAADKGASPKGASPAAAPSSPATATALYPETMAAEAAARKAEAGCRRLDELARKRQAVAA